MDQYSWGFLLTVIFDFVVMIILIIVFCYLKKYRSNPNPDSKYEVFLSENSFDLKSLLLKTYQTPLSEIKHEVGEEAHHYLLLIKSLAIMISILCPPTVVILIPIYRMGDYYSEDMFAISLGNILNDEKLLAAPFLFFLVFIVFCYYTLIIFMKETLKSSSFNTLNYSRLRIVGLPKNLSTGQLQSDVASGLDMEKDDIYVVPDLSNAMLYQRLLDHADEELLHYLDVEKFKGKREQLRFKNLNNEKVDAIDYWEKQVSVYKEKLENEYKNSVNRNSGVCIVKSMDLKIEVLRQTLREIYKGARITSIVVPSDINWENIQNDEFVTRLSHVGGTLLFFFIFLILFTPTSFLQIFQSLLDDIGVGVILLGLVGIYLPDILMLLYQLLLVPKSVEYLVKRERHYSKSGEVISSIRKFLLFFLFSMLFLPAIGLGVINIIYIAWTSSFDNFSKIMTVRIYESIFWFLAAVLTQSFIVSFADLAQLGNVIETKYKAVRAISEREEYNAYIPFPMIYQLEYSMLITVFAMILLFSIAYPLILIFGCMYLWIKWFTSFLFILSGFDSFIALSSLVLFGAALSVPVIWIKYNHIRNKLIKEKSGVLIEELYIHPLQNECFEYLKNQNLVN